MPRFLFFTVDSNNVSARWRAPLSLGSLYSDRHPSKSTGVHKVALAALARSRIWGSIQMQPTRTSTSPRTLRAKNKRNQDLQSTSAGLSRVISIAHADWVRNEDLLQWGQFSGKSVANYDGPQAEVMLVSHAKCVPGTGTNKHTATGNTATDGCFAASLRICKRSSACHRSPAWLKARQRVTGRPLGCSNTQHTVDAARHPRVTDRFPP